MRAGPVRLRDRLLLAVFLSLILPGIAQADDLFAQLRLNGADTGQVVHVVRKDGHLDVSAQDLQGLGLVTPGAAAQDWVALDEQPGVVARYLEADAVLDIQAAPSAFRSNLLDARSDVHAPDPAAWGALLNYGVSATATSHGGAAVSTTTEFRLFGPPGVFSTTTWARAGALGDRASRLETRFVHEDPGQMRRWTLGDFVGASLAWSRPFRGAGFSLVRDFSERPDFVTEPLPQLHGSSATPSSLDLYVDGVKRIATNTPAGPFSLTQAPVVDGQGRVSLVVTDALGRQTVQSFDFYGSSDLLRPGLSAYAFEAGWLRSGFGGAHDDYTAPFAQAVLRQGLTDWLTAELRTAAGAGGGQGGAGAVAKLGEAAVLGLAAQGSWDRNRSGVSWRVDLRRQTQAYSVFVGVRVNSDGFRDTASAAGDLILRRTIQAGASVGVGSVGSLGVAYADEQGRGLSARILSANWSHPLWSAANLYANAYQSFGHGGGYGVNLGLTFLLSRGRTGSVEAGRSPGGRTLAATVAQAPNTDGGWAWRARAGDYDGVERLDGEVRRLSAAGEQGVTASLGRGVSAGQVYADGAVVWLLGGRPIPASSIGDSFAVVDTGRPDVPIVLENRLIGRTNAHGLLLAPSLPAYAPVRLQIHPEDLSLSEAPSRTQVEIRPPRGAGLRVDMTVRVRLAAQVRLSDPSGKLLALGAQVRLNGRPAGMVGYDGLAWLEDLEAQNDVEVDDGSGVCHARLGSPFAPAPDGAVALVCR